MICIYKRKQPKILATKNRWSLKKDYSTNRNKTTPNHANKNK
ncbi:hypothetical protein HBZS_103860 [Helicobacter bizzozeronii CCUG 35545]|nr:hypothetical protein HBZS_103860 [Helicobacter bizzozeronii CCUG 35545]